MRVWVPATAIYNSFIILACSSASRWKGNFSPRWGLPRCCNNCSLPCTISARLCQSRSSMSSLFCRCMSRWRGTPAGSVLGLALKQLQRELPWESTEAYLYCRPLLERQSNILSSEALNEHTRPNSASEYACAAPIEVNGRSACIWDKDLACSKA